MNKSCHGTGWSSGNTIVAKKKYFPKKQVIQVYLKTCKTVEHKIKLQSRIIT